ncbi:hypothetical protein [Streptomyces anulatus]|uniref:hypothetical protein n=1 Tax=Streptomyces anulatus TaxID=1892 RepID=UPI001C25514C|nr:hypothetical protein [Streptomyces anulatus]
MTYRPLSPTFIFALVKGAAEGDPIKHTTPLGLGSHLNDAVDCGLLTIGSSEYDLHLTETGRTLYENHLKNLPDGRANSWGIRASSAAVDRLHQLRLEATDRSVVVEAELAGPGHGTVTVLQGTHRIPLPRGVLGRTRNNVGRTTGWYVDQLGPHDATTTPARATGRTKDDAIRNYLRTLGIQPDATAYARIRYTPR